LYQYLVTNLTTNQVGIADVCEFGHGKKLGSQFLAVLFTARKNETSFRGKEKIRKALLSSLAALHFMKLLLEKPT
jgi:hypothetical protein